jgi:hypothetical protein
MIKHNVVKVQVILFTAFLFFFFAEGMFLLLPSFLFGGQYFKDNVHNVYRIMQKFVLNCPSSCVILIALRFRSTLYHPRLFLPFDHFLGEMLA